MEKKESRDLILQAQDPEHAHPQQNEAEPGQRQKQNRASTFRRPKAKRHW